MTIDGKAHCHICGAFGPTFVEKCKLDCDGFEHEFCQTCSDTYTVFRAKLGTPQGERAFKELVERRDARNTNRRAV